MIFFAGFLNAQSDAVRLQDVRRIYVASLGSGEGAEVIRGKVINYLVKSGRVEVVETEDQADAILTGGSRISKSAYYSATATTASGRTKEHATAGVRLIGKNSGILWVDDASDGIFAWSATSSLSERIAKDLLKAISTSRK